jgi:hydroxylaminobenzene mutase
MEIPMRPTSGSWFEGHRLVQLGVLLLLLGLLVGFVVRAFAVPRLGLTAHVLGVIQGMLLMLFGLLWPRLKLKRTASVVGFWMAAYSCYASWAATVLAAAWGAGGSMMPIAAGQNHGSAAQEGIIAAGLVTSAIALIVVTGLILKGLGGLIPESSDTW